MTDREMLAMLYGAVAVTDDNTARGLRLNKIMDAVSEHLWPTGKTGNAGGGGDGDSRNRPGGPWLGDAEGGGDKPGAGYDPDSDDPRAAASRNTGNYRGPM